MKLLSLFLHYAQMDHNEIMLPNNITSNKYITKKTTYKSENDLPPHM
jgi:hypothetical protein